MRKINGGWIEKPFIMIYNVTALPFSIFTGR